MFNRSFFKKFLGFLIIIGLGLIGTFFAGYYGSLEKEKAEVVEVLELN